MRAHIRTRSIDPTGDDLIGSSFEKIARQRVSHTGCILKLHICTYGFRTTDQLPPNRHTLLEAQLRGANRELGRTLKWASHVLIPANDFVARKHTCIMTREFLYTRVYHKCCFLRGSPPQLPRRERVHTAESHRQTPHYSYYCSYSSFAYSSPGNPFESVGSFFFNIILYYT